MCSLYQNKALLKLVLILVATLPAALVPAATFEDPEDSPLYARSVREAFARMTARTGWSEARNSATRPGTVVMVDGTQWYNVSDLDAMTSQPAARGKRPAPLDITTDITCAASCMVTSCGSTCDASPTCRLVLSCHVPQPTCADFSCGTGPTCSGSVTCSGYPTCDNSATCIFSSTCNNQQPTCGTFPTCTGTCAPASCQTTLYGVSVPQPGQLQLSFASSTQLKYVLQYSTNLSSGAQWAEACSTNGNGGAMTLSHSNGAPIALYRLLIQNP